MMKSIAYKRLLRQLYTTSKLRQLSVSSQLQPDLKSQSFRAFEHEPINHDPSHVGQFYTVSPTDKKLFLYGGLPKSFETQTKTFNETCIMIRKPAVDLIHSLKSLNYSSPAVRFVLFGKKGTGRSLSLAHVLHYAYKSGFLIVHVPWVGNWMRRCKESSNSETKEGLIDINLDAAAWLVHFKSQNEQFLSEPVFQTSKEYVWSKREATPKGSPLTDLIDHGINRLKYASDCIVILAEELKQLTKAGHCKTLVAIDGFNAFFYPHTRILTEKKEVVHPHKITITEAFLNLTKYDWHNAAIVLTVDEIAIAEKDHTSHLPRYLLGKDGFEHLDPFVPVFVDNYSSKEMTSCMNYYRERKWISVRSDEDDEFAALSAYNPYNLMQICAAL